MQLLLELNQQFYQTFALQFSATRQRLQPGVRQLLTQIPLSASILDLGCGNGELGRALAERGQQGLYIGVDSSDQLLAQARSFSDRKELPGTQSPQRFLKADLTQPGWQAGIQPDPFDFVTAFAVLHHIPGDRLRRSLLAATHDLIAQQGYFIHSEWQFLNSPRLRLRLQPWEIIQIRDEDVDPGDFLIDWRQGGVGLRYVHHFSEDELNDLAGASGFRVRETFYSDGETGNLSLYQRWEKE
jgi:tRNA (uracil-5-)-methyltransferase TRM9